MGNCSVATRLEHRQAVIASRRIDAFLKRDSELRSRNVNLLLLGKDPQNAFMRQLRARFPVPWDDLSDAGRERRRQEVFRAILTQMEELVNETEMREDEEVEGKERLKRDALRCVHGAAIEMDIELRNCLLSLWRDRAIQETFQAHRSDPALETLEYFMQKADDILQGGPITNADWLRVPYTSIGVDTLLYNSHNVMFRIVNGVNRVTEGTKWIHMLDVAAIFYLVPLDDYDRSLENDHTVNALEASMARFGRMLDIEHFRTCGVILFFTNVTSFREKILLTPIKGHDPANPELDRWLDYTELEGIAETEADARIAVDEGIKYFCDKFLAVNHELDRGETL